MNVREIYIAAMNNNQRKKISLGQKNNVMYILYMINKISFQKPATRLGKGPAAHWPGQWRTKNTCPALQLFKKDHN